jgi:hypothetical protein
LNLEAVTDEEVSPIRNAIEPKVKSAIKSKVKIWEIFDDQDDMVGFSHVAFIGDELQSKEFEFPEFVGPGSKNHYVLSGSLTVGPVPPDRPCCAEQIAETRGKIPLAKEELQRREAALRACEALPVPPVDA